MSASNSAHTQFCGFEFVKYVKVAFKIKDIKKSFAEERLKDLYTIYFHMNIKHHRITSLKICDMKSFQSLTAHIFYINFIKSDIQPQ